MTDSTEVAWEVDDVSLQTFCRNVTSLGPKYRIPPLRGEDQQVAYRRGRIWRPKTADSDTVTLGMWVTAMNEDGSPPSIGQERKFHENMRALQTLLHTDGRRQVELKKKWRDPTTGQVVFANALAEVQPFQAEMRGPYSARFAVDFLLADPYFYGALRSFELFQDVDVPEQVLGDVTTDKITLEFNGPLTNPTLTNKTPTPDVWVRLGSTVTAGDRVFVGVEHFTAVRESDDANLVGALSRSGAREMFLLQPGSNTLRLEAGGTAGTVKITYAPAYL